MCGGHGEEEEEGGDLTLGKMKDICCFSCLVFNMCVFILLQPLYVSCMFCFVLVHVYSQLRHVKQTDTNNL